MSGHTSNIKCLDFHPFSELIASGSLDTNIRVCSRVRGAGGRRAQVWDVRRKSSIQTHKGHTDAVNCVKFSPDGRLLVSGAEDGTIKVCRCHRCSW